MLKSLSSACGERVGLLTAWAELTAQAVEWKWACNSGLPGPTVALQVVAVTTPQPAGKLREDQEVSREWLWQEFFSDPSHLWNKRWNKRFHKTSPPSPNCRHKRTGEGLWIEGWSNLPWVRAQLSARFQGRAQSWSGAHYGPPSQEYSRMAAFNPRQLFEFGTRPPAFESLPREGINKNFFGTSSNVRTLCRAGQIKQALHNLDHRGNLADSSAYAYLLQECIKMKGLAEGKQVHAHILQSGSKTNIFLLNTLINMYVKCGSLLDACQVFDKMPTRDLFTWNTMIGGYAKHGCGREAFEIYEQMQCEGVAPDRVTFVCIVNACASLSSLEKGKEVHADIIKAGIAPDIVLETALANMYAKCGSIHDAREVFNNMGQQNVVSWNVMIGGYAQHGYGREAVEIYEQMIWERVMPDKVTFICILTGCASLGALEKGKEVHADIIKAGILPDTILETVLVDMYAKCGSMKDAHDVFDKMAQRNVVLWNAMISGYARHGYNREALEFYEGMIAKGVTPNKVTFTCVLNACASLAALEKGKEVHADIIKAAIAPDVILETAMASMYVKCGAMKDAHQVFDNMAQRDIVSWSAMIAGYAQHGGGRKALQLFEQMQQEGLKPNGITFISVLSACSHVGLVDEGHHYFGTMIQDHGLTPTVEHFVCMVDLLGRLGRLDDAEDFIKKMPIEPGKHVWGALLSACRSQGDVKLAERAAKCLLKWDPQHISSDYAETGKLDDTATVSKMMEGSGVSKEPRCCCMEVDN